MARYPLRLATALFAATTVIVCGLALLPARRAHAATQTLLVVRDITDLRTLDPGHAFEVSHIVVDANCYDTLVAFQGTDVVHVRPDLATSWSISPDGTVYTFHLRHGVRFSNGDPLTAADVVFSYRRLKNLGDNPSFFVGGMTDIRALDTYTVRITLGAPDYSFLAALTGPSLSITDAKVLLAHGGDDSPAAATRDKATSFLNAHTAGTGAYMMTNWTRNVQIVMVRNPYYWGPRPFFDKIIIEDQKDTATQRLLVQRGAADVAMGVDLEQAQALMHDPGVRVVKADTLDTIYVGMTTLITRSAPLANKLVRQAVRYAIDYDGILKGLLKGVGTRSNSPIPVGVLGNDPATNDKLLVHQNLAEARALLRKAGYPNGFAVKLSYPVGYTFDGVLYDPLASKVQNDLARVGIKVTLDPEQFAVMLPAYRAQKLEMVVWAWGADYPDANDFAGPFSPGGGVASRLGYTWDTHLTALVNQADSTADRGKRAALYQAIERIWLDEGPWAPLVQPQAIVVIGRDLKGYSYSITDIGADFRTVSR